DALVEGEHRLLVMRVADDADDDAVEDPGRARDHVEVPVRHRVVGAGTDRRDHSCANTVTRVRPYLRLLRTTSGSSGSVRAAVSTKTAFAAPRDRASSPIAPDPA